MTYPSYLIHFNRNHDKNGRFTYGDGDGKVNTKSSDRYKKNTGLHKVTYNTNGNNKFRGSESVANAKFTAGKINRTGFGESLARNSSNSRFTRRHEGTQTTASQLSKNLSRPHGAETRGARDARHKREDAEAGITNSKSSLSYRTKNQSNSSASKYLTKNARRDAGAESKPYGGSGGGGGSSSTESGGTMMIDKDLVEAAEEFVEEYKKKYNNLAVSKGMARLFASTGRNANERTNSSSYRSTDSSRTRGDYDYDKIQEHRNVAPEQYLYKRK